MDREPRPVLLAWAYLELQSARRQRFCLLTLSAHEGGARYSVERRCGRMSRIPKDQLVRREHDGAELAGARLVYDRVLARQLRAGYTEVTLPADEHDAGGIAYGVYLRVERGASLTLRQPELAAPLAVDHIGMAEVSTLDESWRFERAGDVGYSAFRSIHLISARRGVAPVAIELGDRGGRRRGGRMLQVLADAVRAGGLAPAVIETIGGWHGYRQELVELYEIAGADQSATPGAERRLLRVQISHAIERGFAVREALIEPRPGDFGYSLRDGRRAWITR